MSNFPSFWLLSHQFFLSETLISLCLEFSVYSKLWNQDGGPSLNQNQNAGKSPSLVNRTEVNSLGLLFSLFSVIKTRNACLISMAVYIYAFNITGWQRCWQ